VQFEGKLPRESWHNVHMAQGALIPVPETTHTPVGRASRSGYGWRQVESGLPLVSIDDFSKQSGISTKLLQEVVIPLRTLKHRRQRKESLNMDESDRLGRIVRTFELAVRVYGDASNATDWLTSPKLRFDDRTPLAMLRTGAGELAVQEFLIQIDEGYFA
jgi:putative toxin-antitoxin system antitoxin component (TIGR02293 family)